MELFRNRNREPEFICAETYDEKIEEIRKRIDAAEAIVIGAGGRTFYIRGPYLQRPPVYREFF